MQVVSVATRIPVGFPPAHLTRHIQAYAANAPLSPECQTTVVLTIHTTPFQRRHRPPTARPLPSNINRLIPRLSRAVLRRVGDAQDKVDDDGEELLHNRDGRRKAVREVRNADGDVRNNVRKELDVTKATTYRQDRSQLSPSTSTAGLSRAGG